MRHFLAIGLSVCAAIAISPAYAASPSGAPLPPTDVHVTFPYGALEGYVEFTAPQKTVAGDEITANLSYTITAGDTPVAEGSVYPGVSASVNIVMEEKGIYTFLVSVANDAGSSDAVSYTAGAGYAPADMGDPSAALQPDGSVLITWPAATSTMNGTSLASQKVTYDVVRSDGVKVASGISGLSASDRNFDGSLHAYCYMVTAIWNATPSEQKPSNHVVVGSAGTPFATSFATEDDMNLFTVIDGNDDGYKWNYYVGEVIAGVSSDRDADDWLISPPIRLNGNGVHPMSVELKVRDSDYPGRVEVRYGYSPDPAAMTNVAIPAVDFNHTGYRIYSGTASAAGSDNRPVYFGIHNMTKADSWYVYATNFKVEASAEGLVPGTPENLKAVPDRDGRLIVTVSLNAPQLDLSGDPLEAISRIEILRDGTLIHSFDAVSPGDNLEFTDANGLTEGDHTYTAVAYNNYGSGPEAKAYAYAGIDLPATPAAARAYETDVNGIVTIEWEPVTTTIAGAELNPELVTYNIWTDITGQDMKIAAGLKGGSHTFRVILEGEPQMFFKFGVTAETSKGENLQDILTEYIPLGEPAEVPYEDSFPDLQSQYTYVLNGSDYTASWDNASDNTFEEVKSQDSDNGMIYLHGRNIGTEIYLNTGKISLRDVASPMLTFYVFNIVGDLPDTNTVEVFADCGSGDYESLGKWTLADFGTEDWHRIAVPLDKYKDKSVRFRLAATINSYQYVHIDNLQVRSRRNYDLAITSAEAPERLKCGNDCPIVISLANFGLNDAAEFDIEVLRDGKNVAVEHIVDFPTDGRREITVPVHHSVTTPEKVTYDVRINYAPDQYPANNAVPAFEVITISPQYPIVTDLKATYFENPNEITLTWSAPDLSDALEDDVVEDFEDAGSWDTSVEGWKFVDNDRQYIYGFEPWVTLPAGAPTAQSLQSWWVADASYAPLAEHFSDPQFYMALSGDKYMISMAVTDEDLNSERSDDWAISPELPGSSQTISLWAKSMLSDAPESFEVLYSQADRELSSFKAVQTIKNVGWEWTQYFFDLPEGAKYFAIRSISRDAYVLMIDDINFIPAGKGADLEIAGYNVYRSGERLNDTPVAANTFADTLDDSTRRHVYNVTAVYKGRGESGFSNNASPTLSSVDTVTDAISVSTSDGALHINGASGEQVDIFSANGILIRSLKADAMTSVSLDAGIYIVRVSSRTWKVTVR